MQEEFEDAIERGWHGRSTGSVRSRSAHAGRDPRE
jgi:hypothetical protein